MKALIFSALAIVGATSAHAATVPGFSDVQDNGGGSYTFFFDTLPNSGGDIDGTGDGLSFSGHGLSLVATSAQGRVRQDVPSDGGLGVLGRSGSDNLELSLGETLLLTFSRSLEIVNWTFNGLQNSNGHTDAANGGFRANSSGGSHSSFAHLHDGVGGDYIPDNFASMCDVNTSFCDTSTILFGQWPGAQSQFKGYLESITVRISPIPLPASFGFLALGLAGLGVVGRKKRS